MNTVKILHTADLHLGSYRTGIKSGKNEIENTFLRIINLCKTEKVDFLLIAGDLFESPFVSAEDASRIISAIGQIPDTIVAISPGNHDYVCPGSVYLKYKFPDNTIIFSSFMEYADFPEKGVRLWGAGFTDRFENFALLKKPDDLDPQMINLCVLHGETVTDGSSSQYNPVTPSAVENSGFDYIALGHIHKRSDIYKLGKTRFAYSGCPDGTGFDEPGEQGVYLGTISQSSCEIEYFPTSSRQYVIESIDISSCANSVDAAGIVKDHISNKFGNSFNNNLYRISLTGSIAPDTSISAAQVQTLLLNNLNYIEVLDKTDSDISQLETLKNENSLRGIFVRKMIEKISSAPEEEIQIYKNALKTGLRAFGKGVKLDDN